MEVCSAARLQQTIKIRGCQPRTVVNRYCYGQCNSFFIPRPATTTKRRKKKAGRRAAAALAAAADDVAAGASVSRRGRAKGRRRAAATALSAAADDGAAAAAARVNRRDRALKWVAFRSCSYCRPKRVEWITVGLSCPGRRPSYRRRRVQIVKECACAALTLD